MSLPTASSQPSLIWMVGADLATLPWKTCPQPQLKEEVEVGVAAQATILILFYGGGGSDLAADFSDASASGGRPLMTGAGQSFRDPCILRRGGARPTFCFGSDQVKPSEGSPCGHLEHIKPL